jgi:hypothetical protein
MKPTVGRHVHFHPKEGVTHAAIITAVHSDTCVNLAVYDSNGGAYAKTSVQLVGPGQAKPEFGFFCEWMAHEVERSRTEANMSFALSKSAGDAMERIIQKIDVKIAAEAQQLLDETNRSLPTQTSP